MQPPPSTKIPRLRLRVTATAETILRGGHPWLFADSIREQNRDGQSGELAVIYDRKDQFLAVGLYDPESPLRVRVLHAGKPLNIDDDWWRENFSQAVRSEKEPSSSLINTPFSLGEVGSPVRVWPPVS